MAKTTTAATTAKKAPARKGAAKKAPAAKAPAKGEAKARFAKAIDEARAGVKVLGKDAQAKAGTYRDKLAAKSGDWVEDAKDLASQAKGRAGELAREGKARTSDALSSLGRIVADNAGTIDEKLGARYGDYARSAARSMQETAARIEAKDFDELGEDAKNFVRKNPGLSLGLAVVAGFLVARMFRSGETDEA